MSVLPVPVGPIRSTFDLDLDVVAALLGGGVGLEAFVVL